MIWEDSCHLVGIKVSRGATRLRCRFVKLCGHNIAGFGHVFALRSSNSVAPSEILRRSPI